MKCKFQSSNWSDGEVSYYCRVENNRIFNNSRVKIDNVNGGHLKDKTDFDVKGLFISSISNVGFMPEYIQYYFDLTKISIISSNLLEISQSDLKPFPNLHYLNLLDNSIKVIEADLFQFNPGMTHIFLNKNQITSIEYGAFDGLFNIKNLNLKDNKCRNALTQSTLKSDILIMISRIKAGDCMPVDKVIERFRNLEEIASSYQNLTQQMIEMSENLTYILDEIEILSFNHSDLQLQHQNVQTKFDESEGENQKLVEEIDGLKNLQNNLKLMQNHHQNKSLDLEQINSDLRIKLFNLTLENELLNEFLDNDRETAEKLHETITNLVIGCIFIPFVFALILALVCIGLKQRNSRSHHISTARDHVYMEYLRDEENRDETVATLI